MYNFFKINMFNDKEDKSIFLIIILLIAIIFLQVIHLIKLHEVSLQSQMTNMAIYGGNIHKVLKGETERLKRDAKHLRADFTRRNVAKDSKKNIPLLKSKNYDEKKQNYILEIFVPAGLEKDNVELELRNDVLGVAFAGYVQLQNGQEAIGDVFSVYRFFEIPQTKATMNDVKYDIKNDILTVIIPVIK